MTMQESVLESEDAKQIERLLDASRHAVYSAKALKDIHADLQLFQEMEKPFIVEQFEKLQQHVANLYTVAIGLIDRHHDPDYFREEIDSLQSKLKLFHHEFMHKLYRSNHAEMTGLELSTLMNVNREVRASCSAFLKSIAMAWYAKPLATPTPVEVVD